MFPEEFWNEFFLWCFQKFSLRYLLELPLGFFQKFLLVLKTFYRDFHRNFSRDVHKNLGISSIKPPEIAPGNFLGTLSRIFRRGFFFQGYRLGFLKNFLLHFLHDVLLGFVQISVGVASGTHPKFVSGDFYTNAFGYFSKLFLKFLRELLFGFSWKFLLLSLQEFFQGISIKNSSRDVFINFWRGFSNNAF